MNQGGWNFDFSRAGWAWGAIVAIVCMWPALSAPLARADVGQLVEFTHSPAEIREAEEAAKPPTDLRVAEELPHRDLGRGESEELLEGVFGPLIESPAGIFGDLDTEKFISNQAAVVSGSQLSDITGEAMSAEEESHSFLLESTTPLRTESADGVMEPVDLGLESVFGTLRPSNPLVEVAIPSQLGEGIELPEAGVQVALEGAPAERSPSTVGETVAFYPNVDKDTDFAVAPTPMGLETLTQIRSPEAPRTQTLNLQLPAGALLEQTPEGGAVAIVGGEPLVTVLPPTAVDAAGNPVPTDLVVDGDSLRISISPNSESRFPIAVDPNIWDNYTWVYDGHPGWTGANTGGYGNAFRAPDTGCSTYCYLRTSAQSGTYETNTQTYWQYAVPRFFSDYENPEFHEHPRSYIQAFKLGQITLATAGDWTQSPGALFAVSDENGAWRYAAWFPPNISGSWEANLNGDHSGRLASFGLFSTSRTSIANERYLLTGEAQIALGDDLPPKFSEYAGPEEWVNTEAKPFPFTVSDTGLGVSWFEVKKPNGESIGATSINNCGTVRNPCPRRYIGGQEGHTLNYSPGYLPQGINNVTLQALDPTLNSASVIIQMKVDHTAPEVSLSGSITEQATLGKTLPQYTLHVSAKDGTTESPQSGVAKIEIKVDGKKKKEWTPGCPTSNCAFSEDWIIASSAYSVGKHKAEVIATDAVGIKSTLKTVEFEIQRDMTAPQLAPAAIFYTAPEGWLEQKSYSYDTTATDVGGYGVKSLTLKIDGATVKSVTQSCPAGGCSKSFGASSVNLAAYEGGAHSAELIATDGAGNTATKAWTLNVDPAGSVGPSEATSTLEAADATSDSTVVASSDEAIPLEEREAGNDPKIVQEGQTLTSVGAPTTVEYTADPSEGVTIETPEGPIEVTPTSGAAKPTTTIAEEAASVTPNTSTEVDTVIRPIYDGVMNFQAIRGSEAPETYSWQVNLHTGQYLEETSDHAAVGLYYEDGTEGMLIYAEPAHDAVGVEVPTSLAKTGSNEITLTVKHRSAAFTYPIIAGPGFSTAYQATTTIWPTIEGPPVETTPPGGGNVVVESFFEARPPEPDPEAEVGGGGAEISGIPSERIPFYTAVCAWFERDGPCTYAAAHNPNNNRPETPALLWHYAQQGTFHIKRNHKVWYTGDQYAHIRCVDAFGNGAWVVTVWGCAFNGPQWEAGSGAHLVARSTAKEDNSAWDWHWCTDNYYLLYPDGFGAPTSPFPHWWGQDGSGQCNFTPWYWP
jgi:hypothetical protein